MAILSILLTVIIIAVSILIVLIVLAQRPKQEGLGAAFGGGTLDSALGAHTTDILQKITTWLGVIFFVSAVGLAMVKTREFNASAASDVLEGVENREPEVPGVDPAISNRPDLSDPLQIDDNATTPGTPAPITGDPAAPETGFDLPGGDNAPAGDASADNADNGKAGKAETGAAPEGSQAEQPATEQSKGGKKAPAKEAPKQDGAKGNE